MERSAPDLERRRYPRYYPDRENQPRVSFRFDHHSKVSIDLVNISQGGMLGCTSNGFHFPGTVQQQVNHIKISFPGKQPFCCSGKIIRIQPTRENYKFFCAVQFDEIGTDSNKKPINIREKIDQVLHPAEEIVIPDQIFIYRLEKTENYFQTKDPDSEKQLRKQVYDSFDDITSNLSLEEQWWFFEIVDEMKRHEPNYPDKLKTAFLTLCRIGLEQAMRETHEANEE